MIEEPKMNYCYYDTTRFMKLVYASRTALPLPTEELAVQFAQKIVVLDDLEGPQGLV
jgi:hypothetical protein